MFHYHISTVFSDVKTLQMQWCLYLQFSFLWVPFFWNRNGKRIRGIERSNQIEYLRSLILTIRRQGKGERWASLPWSWQLWARRMLSGQGSVWCDRWGLVSWAGQASSEVWMRRRCVCLKQRGVDVTVWRNRWRWVLVIKRPMSWQIRTSVLCRDMWQMFFRLISRMHRSCRVRQFLCCGRDCGPLVDCKGWGWMGLGSESGRAGAYFCRLLRLSCFEDPLPRNMGR